MGKFDMLVSLFAQLRIATPAMYSEFLRQRFQDARGDRQTSAVAEFTELNDSSRHWLPRSARHAFAPSTRPSLYPRE